MNYISSVWVVSQSLVELLRCDSCWNVSEVVIFVRVWLWMKWSLHTHICTHHLCVTTCVLPPSRDNLIFSSRGICSFCMQVTTSWAKTVSQWLKLRYRSLFKVIIYIYCTLKSHFIYYLIAAVNFLLIISFLPFLLTLDLSLFYLVHSVYEYWEHWKAWFTLPDATCLSSCLSFSNLCFVRSWWTLNPFSNQRHLQAKVWREKLECSRFFFEAPCSWET